MGSWESVNSIGLASGKDAARRGVMAALSCMLMLMLMLALAGCAAPHGALRHFKSGQCKPGKPLAGVYLPSRLRVVKGCLTVTGIVDCVQHEPDGDVHIRLRLAPRYRRFLRPANAVQVCAGRKGKAGHGPHLVVEIIPQRGGLPFPDNSADRAGFVTPRAPRVGDHISVTGPYVLDTNALHDLIFPGKQVKNWAEIHPAWNVTVRRQHKNRHHHSQKRA